MNLPNKILAIVLFLLSSISIFSQNGCAVDAGIDQTLDCASGNCTNLSVSFIETGETDTYNVVSIPYAPPFDYALPSGTPININNDDRWSDVIDLPFTFCFFGNNYNQLIVGTNGEVSFNVSDANSTSDWEFTNTIPTNNTGVTPVPNAIFGAYHDLNLSAAGSSVVWDITGTAPCRNFVVSFKDVPHYDCDDIITTQQIVLYETTNTIEVYIQDKPDGCSWNNGNAVIGIQNETSTIAYTPPG
jgi:hypothetical protein